jgi:D-alanyl-D-alanine endopeptidase (penicillin-binding protein 7)
MMIVSDNAAAEALAALGGGEAFVARMNQKARALGMADTSFSDASGLSYLNQTTVLDLDKLVAHIGETYPEIFAWSREPSVAVNGTELRNINAFTGRPDFEGGKTGFTDEANGNLISLFRTDRGTLVVIMLGAPDKQERFVQTERLHTWLSQHFKL